jgi:hypothetical protein
LSRGSADVNRRCLIGVVALALLAPSLLAVVWLSGNARSTAADTFRVFIDTDTTDGICDLPEDSSLSLPGGTSFSVAVCLEDPPFALMAFAFEVVYDDTVILAPEVADVAPALDDNPDANQAALGGGWDCSAAGFAYPTADIDPATGAGHGWAKIGCYSLAGPWTFTSTGYIALISFQTQGVSGSSAVGLQNVVLGGISEGGAEMGSCNPTIAVPMPCVDGAVAVGGAPIATSTPVVTPGTTPAVTPGTTPAATPGTTPGVTPTPAPTPPPGQAQSVDLAALCNPVTTTYPDGTTVQTLAAAISPPDILNAMWAFEGGSWLGYSPPYPEASNLATRDFLDVVFLCVDAPGTFVRPLV